MIQPTDAGASAGTPPHKQNTDGLGKSIISPLPVVSIAGVQLRQELRDEQQYFCCNDVHGASGAEKRHSVSYFLNSRVGRELVAALKLNTEIPAFTSKGRGGGTYAIAEVVIAYAAWISAAFHAHVLQTFLRMQQSPPAPELTLAESLRLAADLVEENEQLQTSHDALQRLSGADGSLTPTQAAKSLKIKPKKLFHWLEKKRWITRGSDGSWVGYQHRIDQGHLEHKSTTINRDGRPQKHVTQVLVTPRGLTLLARRLGD